MRFILLTIIISTLTWILWPWIKRFFKYLKKKYDIAIPITEEKSNANKVSEQSQTTKQTTNTGENNNDSD